MKESSSESRDARYHAGNIRRMLQEVADHAREDVGKVDDERAKALFETTAETLKGMINAYGHYGQGVEGPWRQSK